MEVTNLGVNGWTTAQIIDHQAPRLADRAWDIVSVLAGVNDEYQGVDPDAYRERIERLHGLIAARAPRRVVALSIPDYSYTPVGRAAKPPEQTLTRLRAFNGVAEVSARQRGFTWIDLFEVSRARLDDPAWVGPDGLHPSDTQYAAWAAHILPLMPELG